MKKLVRGIVEFRKTTLPDYREKFAHLALGQSPDTLFIACSDSRVVPNLFASTEPGDLFVVRNIGNLVPACEVGGLPSADASQAAAIEFAVLNLNVENIIVCGHSDCAAIRAIAEGRNKIKAPHLREWLRHGEPALKKVHSIKSSANLIPSNQLSQTNVLQQLDHLRTYPFVQERIQSGKLKLHAWWFELTTAHVYAYEEDLGTFVEIDEPEATRILKKITEQDHT